MRYEMTSNRVKLQFTDNLNRISRTAKQKGLRVALKELDLLKRNLKNWCDDYQVSAEYCFNEIGNIHAISANILVKKIDGVIAKINECDIK